MDAYIQANAYLVFAIVMIAAALLHWGQKVRKGEATGKFVDYWITETPGYSLGTLGALVGAWWIVMTTSGLDKMASHMVIEGAFATGWAINSAVAPGSAAGKLANDAKNAAAGFVRLSMLPWLIFAVLGVILVCGCATAETNAQRFYQAQSNYNTGLTVAVAYKALPTCPLAPICKKDAIVKDLQDADDVAAPAVLSAQACVRSPTCTNADLAVTAANTAVAALTKITQTLVIKEQQ